MVVISCNLKLLFSKFGQLYSSPGQEFINLGLEAFIRDEAYRIIHAFCFAQRRNYPAASHEIVPLLDLFTIL